MIVPRADVAELADASDLKSDGTYLPYRFEPGHRHHRERQAPLRGLPFFMVPLPKLEPVVFAFRKHSILAFQKSSLPALFGEN